MIDPDAVVYIVDDDPAARASVAALVQSKGVRTCEFASAEEFLESALHDDRGCLVLDVRMTGMTGLELQEELGKRKVELPIIVITGFADVPMAVKAMSAGAVNFLTKPCKTDELWENIKEALERQHADRSSREQREAIEARMATLTEDETAVLARVMDGLPNKRIARELDIGLRTVELRRSNVMKKMNAESLAELIQMAVMIGFPAGSENGDAE
jgi:two-component system response regulator FixJ